MCILPVATILILPETTWATVVGIVRRDFVVIRAWCILLSASGASR
jgi:hypothetical protein